MHGVSVAFSERGRRGLAEPLSVSVTRVRSILAGVKAASEEELEVKHEGKLLMIVIFYDYP